MRESTLAGMHLEPRGDRAAPRVFREGARPPYAIRWYGATSLSGHFHNFVSSAIEERGAGDDAARGRLAGPARASPK